MPETTDVAPQVTALPVLTFDAYRAAVSHSVVPLDVHTNCPDDFGGYLDSGGAGDIHVFHIRADEHAVHRSHALIARGTSNGSPVHNDVPPLPHTFASTFSEPYGVGSQILRFWTPLR